MKLNLPFHSYQLRSRPASPARLVNCFVEALPAGARAPAILKRSPGVKDWSSVGTGPIRGMYSASIEFASGRVDALYVVSGSGLYSVDEAGVATLLGDVGTSGRIDMDSNTDSLVVVAEPRGFYYDGTTFGEILDADFVSRGAGDVEFLDNFLLFREPNSGRFFGAELGSATDFDALDFAVADSAPDNLTGMIVDHRQLVALGERSTEVWENFGSAGFPFERNINGTIEEGCRSGATVAKQSNTVYWVSDDNTVRRLEGLAPVRVSTHAVEQWIAGVTPESLEAFTYEQEGHFFYVLSAIEGTFVFDATTGEWAERGTYQEDNWEPRYYAQFNNSRLIGSSTSNKIGILDFETYTEFGMMQRMEWTYQPVYADQQRAFHKRLEIVLETGVGDQIASSESSLDPKIMLQYSDDGGRVWKTMPDRSLGKTGEHKTRVIWYNLGSSRERVYRCSVTDNVPVTVTDTVLEIDGGRL